MAQLKDTTIDGSLIVSEAAIFGDKATTRQDLNYIGQNPVTIDTDTPATWIAYGTGSAYISGDNIVGSQPHNTGFIENRVHDDIVSQTWYSMDGNGGVYYREGNISGWHPNSVNWVRVIDKKFLGQTLWEGTWNAGTLTVPNTDDYQLFQICMSGQGTTILAARYGIYIRGMGGYSSATPTISTYHLAATVEGDVWTFVACNRFGHTQSGSHGGLSNNVITSIRGII